MQNGQLHHIEYYVDDLDRTSQFWGWLFSILGWSLRNTWSKGIEWGHSSGTYIVFCVTEPAHRSQINNRQAAGLNHLAFSCELSISKQELIDQLQTRGARIISDEEEYLCFEEVNCFAVELYFK